MVSKAESEERYRLGVRRDDMPSSAADSSTRGGSTSVRGRVRSPHMAKLQAASVPRLWQLRA